jgi:hypothetical protein|tara:strand:+ start:279 stop:398 length:120 start_codon:yes stop_codon:yes gene_type:complete
MYHGGGMKPKGKGKGKMMSKKSEMMKRLKMLKDKQKKKM